jgi:hypothetical protein
MSKYATEKTFAGQRASIGRVVLVKMGEQLGAGIITAIQRNEDRPWIMPLDGGPQTNRLEFHHAQTEQGAEDMPDGRWTWPPRV